MITLQDWTAVGRSGKMELGCQLIGTVYNHPQIPDDEDVTTAVVTVIINNDEVVTQSGSHYILGRQKAAIFPIFPEQTIIAKQEHLINQFEAMAQRIIVSIEQYRADCKADCALAAHDEG